MTRGMNEMANLWSRDFRRDFAYTDPDFTVHHDAVVSDLVENCPVARSNEGKGSWIVTQYADVWRCAQDWQTFTSALGVFPNAPESFSVNNRPRQIPIENDPPSHSAWRRALNPFFSPQRVAEWEPGVRAITDELIDRFVESGRCDYQLDIAAALPALATFQLALGMPAADSMRCKEWIDTYMFEPDEGLRFAAYGKLTAYVEQYLRDRRAAPPRGDVVDAILQLEEVDGVPVTFEDQLGAMNLLVIAGLETTTNALAYSIHHLATHSEDREKLTNDPSLLPTAIEEFLRLLGPTVTLARTATKDVELHGCPIRAGDQVALGWAMADRDPQEFDDPMNFDMGRARNRHLAFGAGPHRCLGSHFARLQMRVALEKTLQRLPNFRLDPAAEPAFRVTFVRSVTALPLVFDAS